MQLNSQFKFLLFLKSKRLKESCDYNYIGKVILKKAKRMRGVIYIIGQRKSLSYYYFEIGLEIYFCIENTTYF